MTYIRLASTDEMTHALEYLKHQRFPILTYPEIIKAVVSEAVAKQKKHHDDITEQEMLSAAAPFFGIDDESEALYSRRDGKPLQKKT